MLRHVIIFKQPLQAHKMLRHVIIFKQPLQAHKMHKKTRNNIQTTPAGSHNAETRNNSLIITQHWAWRHTLQLQKHRATYQPRPCRLTQCSTQTNVQSSNQAALSASIVACNRIFKFQAFEAGVLFTSSATNKWSQSLKTNPSQK